MGLLARIKVGLKKIADYVKEKVVGIFRPNYHYRISVKVNYKSPRDRSHDFFIEGVFDTIRKKKIDEHELEIIVKMMIEDNRFTDYTEHEYLKDFISIIPFTSVEPESLTKDKSKYVVGVDYFGRTNKKERELLELEEFGHTIN